jgi:hypothetical protein
LKSCIPPPTVTAGWRARTRDEKDQEQVIEIPGFRDSGAAKCTEMQPDQPAFEIARAAANAEIPSQPGSFRDLAGKL